MHNHRNAIGTNQWRLDDHCPCTNMRQSTPLASKMCYLLVRWLRKKEDTEVERASHDQGHLGRRISPCFWPMVCQCCLSVVPNDSWEPILKVIGGWWPWTHMETFFVIHLVNFLMCGASQGAKKLWKNKPFLLRWDNVWRCPHRPTIDARQKIPTLFH